MTEVVDAETRKYYMDKGRVLGLRQAARIVRKNSKAYHFWHGCPKGISQRDRAQGSQFGEEMKCPKCGAECKRDEIWDVGVGLIPTGPWGCPECHWVEPDLVEIGERKAREVERG